MVRILFTVGINQEHCTNGVPTFLNPLKLLFCNKCPEKLNQTILGQYRINQSFPNIFPRSDEGA